MKGNIILVDDHAAFRRSLRYFLSENADYRIIAEAENGRELLNLKLTERCDIILLDIAMPIMDGFEALRLLPGIFPEAKTIVVSGRSENGYPEAAFELGASGFIHKDDVFVRLIPGIAKVLAGETCFPNAG